MPDRLPNGDFAPGNSAAVQHGAHAEVLPTRLDAKAAALAAQLATQAPVRDGAGGLPVHDEEVIRLLARCLCRLDDVGAWLDREGTLDKRGKPRSAALWERRLQSNALKLMKELGMTPASRAKLGVNLARAVDLAQALSEPDEQRRAVLMAEAGLTPPIQHENEKGNEE